MSTLRITNIEAKADPSSPTVDEKIKLTNSNGDILVHIDGKTSGITTIGINTTAGNIKFDQNSNVVVTGIITATKFVGTIEPTTLAVDGNITSLGRLGVGTDNPGQKLVIYDNVPSGTSNVFINNAGGDGVLYILNNDQYSAGLGTLTDNGSYIDLSGKWTSANPAANRTFGRIGAFKENNTSANGAGYLGLYSRPDGSSLTERLRIDSAGLVGIGTDNPLQKLHLFDTTSSNIYLQTHNAGTGSTAGVYFRTSDSSTADGFFKTAIVLEDDGSSWARGKLHILQDNTADASNATLDDSVLTINQSGQIGIGTENPLNGVDIVQSDSRTRVTAYGHIITRNHNHSVTNYWSIAPRNGGELDIAYGPADSDGTVTADLVTIKSDGKMGVGTGSPTSLIHGQVSSGSAIATLESTATSGEASVSLKGKNSSGTVRTGIFKYDSADMFRIGTTASIPIRFETNDTERMRILPTGGITFGGDTAQANALNDYEEGTMSWRLQRDDNIGAGSNVNTRVNYTKIGNRVYVSGYIYTQNTGSSTSNVNIILRDNGNTSNVATLPYLPNHSGGFPVTGTRTISDNYRNMAVTFQENSTTVYLYRDDGDNNYVKNVNNVSVSNSQTHLVLQFCGSYTTNS